MRINQHWRHQRVCNPPGLERSRGFTLVELLVVVAIVGVMASLALPRFRLYLIEGRLDEAKPYMMAIAAKERIRHSEKGSYLGAINEDHLETFLGVDLHEASNFCFMVVCRDSTRCHVSTDGGNPSSGTAGAGYISSAAESGIDFEVWGVLRSSGNPATYGSTTCTVATDKHTPTGWVDSDGDSVQGGAGRVVVLRYPPPANGLEGSDSQYHGGGDTITHDWVEGMSVSDVLQQ